MTKFHAEFPFVKSRLILIDAWRSATLDAVYKYSYLLPYLLMYL